MATVQQVEKAFHAAITAETDEVLKHVLEETKEVKKYNHPRTGPLLQRFLLGGKELTTIRLLLEEGVDPNIATENGKTPLMVAAEMNATDALLLLLSFGASLDLTDCFGRTALHCAVWRGARDTVLLLLEKGAQRPGADTITQKMLEALEAGDEGAFVALHEYAKYQFGSFVQEYAGQQMRWRSSLLSERFALANIDRIKNLEAEFGFNKVDTQGTWDAVHGGGKAEVHPDVIKLLEHIGKIVQVSLDTIKIAVDKEAVSSLYSRINVDGTYTICINASLNQSRDELLGQYIPHRGSFVDAWGALGFGLLREVAHCFYKNPMWRLLIAHNKDKVTFTDQELLQLDQAMEKVADLLAFRCLEDPALLIEYMYCNMAEHDVCRYRKEASWVALLDSFYFDQLDEQAFAAFCEKLKKASSSSDVVSA